MKRLILLLDEWNYNRVFVEEELNILREKYSVSIVCNDAPEDKLEGVTYYTYAGEKTLAGTMTALVKMVFDRDFYKELSTVCRASSRLGALSEAVRFYIKAELFFDFVKKNKIIDSEFDGIIYSYWNFYKCYAFSKHRKQIRNARMISRIHGYDLYKEQLPTGFEPFKKAMLRELDALVFISKQGLDYYKENFLTEDTDIKLLDKCSVYHLGVKDYAKELNYKSEDCKLLVSCSSLIPLKAVDRIIKGLATVSDCKIKWIHFGSGEMENTLKELAASLLDVKDNISYEFMGYTKNRDLMQFYADNQVDAFVTTSTNEGMPMSIMEALSFGIPVIATPVGNIPRMIDKVGFMLEDRYSDEELGRMFKRIFGLPAEEYVNMRMEARKLFEKDFDADRNFAKFVSEVIENKR